MKQHFLFNKATVCRHLVRALLLLCFYPLTASAQQHDKLLSLLRDRLKYNFSQLQKQTVKPYFMSYRVEDNDTRTITSTFGVLNGNNDSHVRSFIPQVRVGSMALDNYKNDNSGGRQQGATLPFDDNATDGITTNFWQATMAAYDGAVEAYEDAKSKAATSAADEDKAPCFSKAPAEQSYEEPLNAVAVKLDDQQWVKRLNTVSAVFKADPTLQNGTAALIYEVNRSYLVNTDGTEVVQNRRTARVIIIAQAMADDGMMLPVMQDFFAFNPDSLPSEERLVAAAQDLLKRVQALKAAPVANPYTGPAILSGPAAGVFFHEIFGHRLEGHRLKKGGETFKNMVGKQVLPTTFNVYCDPTLRHYAGVDMNGSYRYDDEGVKARRVDNVVNGVLRSFLMSRKPIDSFPESNGHGRADLKNDPVSRQSNLIVETTKPYTDAQLRAMLIREAKRQGKPYGYFFRTVTSGYTMTGEGGSINSFNVTPVEVYRVFVNGKPDELVRGVSLIGTPLSMFSHIQAAGDRPAVFTGSCGAESGWVPVTACAPAVFVSQIETQRTQKSDFVPPILQAPIYNKEYQPLTNAVGKEVDNVIFTAMSDEMKRSMDSLQLEDAPKPFYLDMMATRSRGFDITGELGGISKSDQTPWHTYLSTHLLLGNYKSTNELPGQDNALGLNNGEQVDYNDIRHAFWQLNDVAYKQAVVLQAQKASYLKQNPPSLDLSKLPNLQPMKPVTQIVDDTSGFDIDMPRLEQTAKRLSAVFEHYPKLYYTSVKISGDQLISYRLTSEGVKIQQPHHRVIITAEAYFRDADQVEQSDDYTFAYESTAEIPADDVLEAQVRAFADSCMTLCQAPTMPKYYKGPALYVDGAAMNALVDNRLISEPSYEEDANDIGQKIGQPVISKMISIINRNDLKSYEGQPVYGHTVTDADGVTPAPQLILVDHGVLKAKLNGAVPTLFAPTTTGSARFFNGPDNPKIGAGFNTLQIQATSATPEKNMLKLLIKQAKKEKLPFAYIVALPLRQSAARLYQVDVKTGAIRLMKTDQDATPSDEELMNILAVSDKEDLFNVINPYTFTVIYPHCFLLNEIELNKATIEVQKEFEIPYPVGK